MICTKNVLFPALVGSAALLTACGGSSGGSDGDPNTLDIGLPGGQKIALLNSVDGRYHVYDTDSYAISDLNLAARTSQDGDVQNMEITDTSTVGHFLHFPDVRTVGEETSISDWYALMKPGYDAGTTVTAEDFVKLVHLHDGELAAHRADEYEGLEAGSQRAEFMERLNAFVTEQAELDEEVGEVLNAAGQSLCRAYVDPYQKHGVEHEGEHDHDDDHDHAKVLKEEGTHEGDHDHDHEGEHDHHELVHFGLTDSGRIYFYHEEEAGLESFQGFVTLSGVETILDCDKTTITRINEEAIMVFVPDNQMLYLVDNHGGEWHEHESWAVAELNGLQADMVAILPNGSDHDHEGEEHDHDHEGEEHDHDHEGEDHGDGHDDDGMGS